MSGLENAAANLPLWAAWATAALVLSGAALTLLGCIGLLRLRTFHQRMHAPTLGTTLGTGGILLGSILFFSVAGTRPVLHEVLIAFFLTVTTPMTFLLLMRAVQYRDPEDPEDHPQKEEKPEEARSIKDAEEEAKSVTQNDSKPA